LAAAKANHLRHNSSCSCCVRPQIESIAVRALRCRLGSCLSNTVRSSCCAECMTIIMKLLGDIILAVATGQAKF